MRTYGRPVIDIDGQGNQIFGAWQEVATDAAGFNDMVYVTTLAQVLKLNLGESPFFSNYGIPAVQSVRQQLPPDFQVALTQQQFSPFFASLIIAKRETPTPIYDVSVITHQGVKLQRQIPIPQ